MIIIIIIITMIIITIIIIITKNQLFHVNTHTDSVVVSIRLREFTITAMCTSTCLFTHMHIYSMYVRAYVNLIHTFACIHRHILYTHTDIHSHNHKNIKCTYVYRHVHVHKMNNASKIKAIVKSSQVMCNHNCLNPTEHNMSLEAHSIHHIKSIMWSMHAHDMRPQSGKCQNKRLVVSRI